MKDCRQFYIDGKWVAPTKLHDYPVINPATEEPIATISLGTSADVDKACTAARKAFASYSETSPEERLALLMKIIEAYQSRYEEMAEIMECSKGTIMSRLFHARRNMQALLRERLDAVTCEQPADAKPALSDMQVLI